MVLASHQQEDTKIKSQTQELLTNNLKGGKKKNLTSRRRPWKWRNVLLWANLNCYGQQ